jgi:hypothetical protein
VSVVPATRAALTVAGPVFPFQPLEHLPISTASMASESAEVAEDYRLALEDLSSNMRFEISNLTVIARENTEHALAIAEVLQQHILKVRPARTYRKGLPWRLAFHLS